MQYNPTNQIDKKTILQCSRFDDSTVSHAMKRNYHGEQPRWRSVTAPCGGSSSLLLEATRTTDKLTLSILVSQEYNIGSIHAPEAPANREDCCDEKHQPTHKIPDNGSCGYTTVSATTERQDISNKKTNTKNNELTSPNQNPSFPTVVFPLL